MSKNQGEKPDIKDTEVLETGVETLKDLSSKDPSVMSMEERVEFRQAILERFTPQASVEEQTLYDMLLARVDSLIPQTPEEIVEDTETPSQIPDEFRVENLPGKTLPELKKIKKKAAKLFKTDLDQADTDKLTNFIDSVDARIKREERGGPKNVWEFIDYTELLGRSPEELDVIAHKVLEYTFLKDTTSEQKVELQNMLEEIKVLTPAKEVPSEKTPETEQDKNQSQRASIKPEKQKKPATKTSAKNKAPVIESKASATPENLPKNLDPKKLEEWVNHEERTSLKDLSREELESRYVGLKAYYINLNKNKHPKLRTRIEFLINAIAKEIRDYEHRVTPDVMRNEEGQTIPDHEQSREEAEENTPEVMQDLPMWKNAPIINVRRTDGTVEKDWHLMGANSGGVTVMKPLSEGGFIKKVISFEEITELNPHVKIPEVKVDHLEIKDHELTENQESPDHSLVGKMVNWESQGALQFSTPKKVVSVEEMEGKMFVFVEGEKMGFPIEQIVMLDDHPTVATFSKELLSRPEWEQVPEAQAAVADIALGADATPEETELVKDVVKRKWKDVVKEKILGISYRDLAVGLATGATIGAVARVGFRAAFGLGGVALGAVTGATVAGGRMALSAGFKQRRYNSAIELLEGDKTTNVLEMVKSGKLHKLDAIKILNDRIQVYKKAEDSNPAASEAAIKLEELKKQIIGKEEDFNKLNGADRLNAYLKLAAQNEVGESIVSTRKKELEELSKEIARATGRRMTAKQLLKAATVGAIGGAIGYTIAHIVGSYFGDVDLPKTQVVSETPKSGLAIPVDTSSAEVPTDTLSAPQVLDSTVAADSTSVPEQTPDSTSGQAARDYAFGKAAELEAMADMPEDTDLTAEERAAEAYAIKQQAALEAMGPTNGNDYMTIEKGSYVSDTINKMVEDGMISKEDASLARNNPLSGGIRGDEFIPLDKAGLAYAGNQVHFIPGENGEAPRFEVVQAEGHQFGSDRDLYNRYKTLGKEPPEWLKRSVEKGWDTLNGLPGGDIEASIKNPDGITTPQNVIAGNSESLEFNDVTSGFSSSSNNPIYNSNLELDPFKGNVDLNSSKIFPAGWAAEQVTALNDSSESLSSEEKLVIDWILAGKILGGAAALGAAGYGGSRIYKHMKSEKKPEDSEDAEKESKKPEKAKVAEPIKKEAGHKQKTPEEISRLTPKEIVEEIVQVLSPKLVGGVGERAFGESAVKEIARDLTNKEFEKVFKRFENAWRSARKGSKTEKDIEYAASLIPGFGIKARLQYEEFKKFMDKYKKGNGPVVPTPEDIKVPESIEVKEKEKHVSFGELEQTILNMLGDKAKVISPIEIVAISKKPGEANLRGEVDAGAAYGRIKINATIKNVGSMLEVSETGLNVDARFYVKGVIKSKLREEFASTIQKHFEDQYKKPVKSIQIKGSELVIITE